MSASKPARKRILVLSSSTGSGHDMRARAFASWVRRMGRKDIDIRIEQVIENGSHIGAFGVWLYNTIQRYYPRVHNLYWFIVEALISSHGGGVSFGGRYYRKLLEKFRPDMVLSMHDSTNRGYFEDAKKVLGDSVVTVTYCGEWSGGYGYSKNWVSAAVDHFYARTEESLDYAVQLGLPADKGKVFHKLLPPSVFQLGMKADEALAYRESELGLDRDRFTVFLATGAFGANHHLPFLRALLRLRRSIQIIVVCGRNQRVHQQLVSWQRRHPDVRLFLEGYSDRMTGLMQVSDAVVTRGGANTTMEALHIGCPIIYNGMGGLMPQETCTVRYFQKHGAAVFIRTPDQLARAVEHWMGKGAAWKRAKEALEALHWDENPEDFIEDVLGKL
ncbi:MAG: glycosyltransferase [Opitutales bacterium]|nr:glycosyltransferase [Opitutales bacterium]